MVLYQLSYTRERAANKGRGMGAVNGNFFGAQNRPATPRSRRFPGPENPSLVGHESAQIVPNLGTVPASMERDVISQQQIAQTVSGVSAEEIDAHFNLLPDRYFAQTDERDVALHLGMVNRLLHNISGADSLGSLRPVIEWQESADRAHSVVHVVTWDRAGLFFKLAGALSVAGFNILSAKITTRNDHIAIDSFELDGAGPEFALAREVFAKTVEEALVNNRDLAPAIAAQSRLHPGSNAKHAPIVDVYLEINSPRAIVEMHVPDRFGLLYRVGRLISEASFSLTAARVQTERGLAIDRFHLEATDDLPLDATRLNALREALLVASIR